MKLKIAVLAGDGIGPEIMEQGVAVMSAVAEKFGHEVEYKEALCGAHAIDEVGDEKVKWVKYCGLPGDKYYELAKKYMPNGSCGVISFGLHGGRKAAETFMKHLKLGSIETHVADSRRIRRTNTAPSSLALRIISAFF